MTLFKVLTYSMDAWPGKNSNSPANKAIKRAKPKQLQPLNRKKMRFLSQCMLLAPQYG